MKIFYVLHELHHRNIIRRKHILYNFSYISLATSLYLASNELFSNQKQKCQIIMFIKLEGGGILYMYMPLLMVLMIYLCVKFLQSALPNQSLSWQFFKKKLPLYKCTILVNTFSFFFFFFTRGKKYPTVFFLSPTFTLSTFFPH